MKVKRNMCTEYYYAESKTTPSTVSSLCLRFQSSYDQKIIKFDECCSLTYLYAAQ